MRAQILKEVEGTYLLSGMLTVRDVNRQIERLDDRRIRRVRLKQNAAASLEVAGKGAT